MDGVLDQVEIALERDDRHDVHVDQAVSHVAEAVDEQPLGRRHLVVFERAVVELDDLVQRQVAIADLTVRA